MPTLEERIATLEGRMTPNLREEMQRGFAETRQELAAVRAETRQEFAAVREGTHRGFAELRDEIGRMRQDMTRAFERVDDRFQRQFTWIVGIQVMTMLTVIGALAAALFRAP